MTKKKKQKEVVVDNSWEIKDRQYFLLGGKEPLTYTLSSRHTQRYPLLWFDEEKNEQRALRYATNQNSPFVDEQKGEVTLKHIQFKDGVLNVPKQYQALQKLLSLYHPSLNKKYAERKPVQVAINEVEEIEFEIDAMNIARSLDIDLAEAILRVEKGTKVSQLSTKELKRDILVFARKNPKLFIQLASDENVQLRNIAIKSVEQGIITLSNKNKDFLWAETKEVIMKVPYGENPYTAFAGFLQTDEGIMVMKSIEKKLY
tara:strand:- start:15705 stop:16481 length:777 start_codon:yes stop_codon:yes gene_type:complete